MNKRLALINMGQKGFLKANVKKLFLSRQFQVRTLNEFIDLKPYSFSKMNFISRWIVT